MSFAERDRLDARIKRVFGQITRLSDDDEVCAELSRYAAVLTSGLLEAACRDAIGRFVEKRAHTDVAEYVRGEVEWFQNPNMAKILTLVGSFGSGRRQHLEAALTDELKSAVDSIVSNKNNIAHGRDSGISPAVVRDYFARCSKVIALIEKVFAA